MSEEIEINEIDPPTELMVIEVQDDFLPALSLEQAIERHTQVKELVSSLMIDGVDYGQIPGTQKPSLWKPGAEKLTTFFGLRVLFIDEKVIEQWDDDDPLFYYRRKCQLWKGNVLIAEASGSANSREDRYRWRWVSADDVPDGDITNLKTKGGKKGMFEWQFEARQTDGQYGKPEEYYEKIDKKIANNQVDRFDKVQHWNKQEAIYMEWEEILYRIPNEEIFTLVNTILKMADKRCLSGSTPMVFKTSRGYTRGRLSTMVQVFRNGNETIQVPGINGEWRTVKGINESKNRKVSRINLADGDYILATTEHKFPTKDGLKSVSILEKGDILLRDKPIFDYVAFDYPAFAIEIAWAAGLFLAEGNFPDQANGVRYTINADRTDLIERLLKIADVVMGTWNIVEKESNSVSINIHGSGFRGMIEDFISGETSYKKHFSKKAFNQGSDFLKSMLWGYLAGDGHWNERKGRRAFWELSFTGKNYELAKDLRTICNVLGFRISIKRKHTTLKATEKTYSVHKGWIKFPSDSYNQKTLETIESVEDFKQPCTVYDIEVDGDHLFLLANGIVSHNSFVAATLIACNASDYFTQDIEDIPEMNKTNIQPSKQTKTKPAKNEPVDTENLILNSSAAMKDGTFTGNEYLDLGKGLGYDKVYVGEIKRKYETKDEKTKKTTTDFVSAAHELIEKYQTANS